MTDDLDDLKRAMQAATPRPDPRARAENIARAMDIFDNQKNHATTQETASAPRHTPATRIWTGVISMLNNLTTKGGLTATTALVAAVFLVTPAGQDLWRNAPRIADGVAASVDPAPEPTPAPADIAAEPELDLAVAEDAATELRSVRPLAPPPAAPRRSAAQLSEAPKVARSRTPQAGPSQNPGAGLTQPTTRTQFNRRTLSQSDAAEVFRRQIPDTLTDRDRAVPETESFASAEPNALKITADDPVSTFSIDVDTASYGVIRSSLNRGQLPARDAVRIEEMINYFPYDYPAPDVGDAPFKPTITTMQTPWNADTRLVQIALQGRMPVVADRPPLNLVFLIDTSGSMSDPTKLPLLRQSLLMMLDQLRPEDEVAIVAYAGSAGVVLEPTPAAERARISDALMRLSAGGSTNGQGGLQQAYAVAERMQDNGDVSRVLLATDGDFNVGLSDPDALKDFIADKRDTGTFLSVLGFGRGNLDDATMQALAQNGNGTAAYIDTLNEAQKVLVDQLTGALFTIASDVKVQVEWNPAAVAEYRLIGYETRALRREDFNNDAVDAGDLGAGHSVTALYEVTPLGSPAMRTNPLRYGQAGGTITPDVAELGFVSLRYKDPGADVSQLLTTPIGTDLPAGTADAGFAAAIAGFGQLLRDDRYLGDWGYDDAIALANANRGDDPFGYRTEAVQLMRLAQSLQR